MNNHNKNKNKTCLNRLLKRCKKCKRDYDTKHHPNNLDCPNYHEINILIVNISNVANAKGNNE